MPKQAFYNGRVTINCSQIESIQLVEKIRVWARELGFSQIGVSGVDLSKAEQGLMDWLAQGFHGDMHYMQSHGLKRARPAELVAGTVSVITARMDYLPTNGSPKWIEQQLEKMEQSAEGVISLYAQGRDYHKVLRSRLQKLAEKIQCEVGTLGFRVFTDSAPVLEVELAVRAGMGWRGKHTLLIDRDAGSMFFLGEIYVDFKLQSNEPQKDHCGTCNVCIKACPTGAIVAPYRLDARRCISYLTIEHAGSIDVALRPLMGNRIYGCDDCQLVCPWNKFARKSILPDFDAREGLSNTNLIGLFRWSEHDFLQRTEGSPIRRIGHDRWLRNIAIALGNALRNTLRNKTDSSVEILQSLQLHADHPDPVVREHVRWAMSQSEEQSKEHAA